MAEGDSGLGGDDLPRAVRTSHIQIGAMTLRCHHLDNGQRVFDVDDVHALFSAAGLADATPDQMAELLSALANAERPA